MTWFRNLNVKNKLLLSFVIVLAIAVGAGVYTIMEMRNINSNYSAVMSGTDSDLIRSVVVEQGARTDRAMYVSIGLFTAIAAITLCIAFYLESLISKPLASLTEFMVKAGSTGDITISRKDEQIIGSFSVFKDEIGRCIKGAAAFIRHVTNIARELESVADGDLTTDIVLLSDSDTMGTSLTNLCDNLSIMFGEIQTSTSQVAGGAKQVADGAQALAQGSTQQAASIQQLSSTISTIADKTKLNAETAERTVQLSEIIRQNAEKGNLRMEEMMIAVRDINEASQSISKIIKTIDDIAFQTNILALNAAVEAARAGQHGAGFAVVAEEVRNLAAKSAAAAKETEYMIQNSMEKVEYGSCIAGETASSLSEIVSGINESGHLIREIGLASEEQTLGISQINIGIDQVAQVIHHNSATAQESAAASEQMSAQTSVLHGLISHFRTNDESAVYRTMHEEEYYEPKRLPSRSMGGYTLAAAEGIGKY